MRELAEVACPYCRGTGIMNRIVGSNLGAPIFQPEPCLHVWVSRVQQDDLFQTQSPAANQPEDQGFNPVRRSLQHDR
jgi:hypothetical protein